MSFSLREYTGRLAGAMGDLRWWGMLSNGDCWYYTFTGNHLFL